MLSRGEVTPDSAKHAIGAICHEARVHVTVPVTNLGILRAVLQFTLKDNGGGGSLLGEPGKAEAELPGILSEKYGDRLATIDGAEVRV